MVPESQTAWRRWRPRKKHKKNVFEEKFYWQAFFSLYLSSSYIFHTTLYGFNPSLSQRKSLTHFLSIKVLRFTYFNWYLVGFSTNFLNPFCSPFVHAGSNTLWMLMPDQFSRSTYYFRNRYIVACIFLYFMPFLLFFFFEILWWTFTGNYKTTLTYEVISVAALMEAFLDFISFVFFCNIFHLISCFHFCDEHPSLLSLQLCINLDNKLEKVNSKKNIPSCIYFMKQK